MTNYHVARTLVSAAPRLISARLPSLDFWQKGTVAPPIFAPTGNCAEMSLGAADTSVRATSVEQSETMEVL
jgi:hypothetical protein